MGPNVKFVSAITDAFTNKNKNTKCPIDAHCHRHCRRDPRITKDGVSPRVIKNQTPFLEKYFFSELVESF